MPAWPMNCGVGSSGSPTQNASTSLRPRPSLYSSRILDAVSARTAARAESGVSGFMEAVILDWRGKGGKDTVRKQPVAGPPFPPPPACGGVRLGRGLFLLLAPAGPGWGGGG